MAVLVGGMRQIRYVMCRMGLMVVMLQSSTQGSSSVPHMHRYWTHGTFTIRG